MKSPSSHQFSMVPKVEIPRSVFDRSHGYKTTFDSGYLIPFYVDEALPGDTFKAKTTLFARLNTPIVPFMDNLWMDTFYFAVPIRLLWDNWKKFNGEQIDPDDSTDFTVPVVPAGVSGFAENSLFDYFGLPVGVANIEVCAFWSRAYNLIWNNWFRDQNQHFSAVVDTGDADDDPADYPLRKRCKPHDYFTSCLPWPQKNDLGQPVSIPLGTTAPIWGTGKALGVANSSASDGQMVFFYGGSDSSSGFMPHVGAGVPSMNYGTDVADPTTPTNSKAWGLPIKGNSAGHSSNIYADLETATAATINDLREAFQIQRWFERAARGGSRYTEIIRSMFGVTSPDSRQQRPEYLGGSSARINITPVQQTSSTDVTTPQGHLAAYGQVADNRGGFTKSFTEHCVILGLVNVRAAVSYQQGIPRMFSRQTKFDFYWPALAHLGEQAVLAKEIFADGTANDDGVFGYQERYAEYRYFPSQITGQFRSTHTTPLDVWHLAEEFASLPTLSDTFLEQDPDLLDRVIAVPGTVQNPLPQVMFDSYMELHCARPMPVYSVPGLIDHF